MNKQIKGKKDCNLCNGSGVMTVANGKDSYDSEECYCTIAYKRDGKLQDISLDSVK